MIQPKTLVRSRTTTISKSVIEGEEGVVVPSASFMGKISGGVPVFFFKRRVVVVGVPEEILEVIGPDNAVANEYGCGVGKGANCCVFLGLDGSGFTCLRFGELHWSIIAKKADMKAQRNPLEAYPGCQLNILKFGE